MGLDLYKRTQINAAKGVITEQKLATLDSR